MTEYFYPERMGRIILQAMDEVLGREGMNPVLRTAGLATYIDHLPAALSDKAFSFETVSHLMESLEQTHGPQGGRGTALRIGRSCFQYGLREYGSMLGITEMAFRLLPLPAKFSIGAKSFADLFNKQTDQRVRIEEKNGTLLWHIERCPLCWGRHTDEPACHLAVGLLQECLYWMSGGKLFNVEEVACVGRGDSACTVLIDRTPLS
ncbi:MAG TPA: V4R domain-containing protein [Anaerolineales bacterium]|jgi:predicted hydrocarbon binding protein|nr:V4R domain-containing protein [Anaerolineales bacterium]